jgi:exopolyphosphatase / guanosine-5'-triphosphate,3'-diphosphate pyrophosphatase
LAERIVAVIDLGSNTVHLLVARICAGALTPLADQSVALQLGADVGRTGVVSTEKLDALLATLRAFQDAAAELGAPRVHVLATQALRIAQNRDALRGAIERATGLRVEILSPGQEAAFAFMGAEAAFPAAGRRVVVDIGGGSMQVSVGEGGLIHASVSLPLGGLRVRDDFMPGDPPTPEEESRLRAHLAAVLPTALPLLGCQVGAAYATGGSARRLPGLIGHATGEPLPPDALDEALALLRGRTAAAMMARYGVAEDRALLLAPTAITLRAVLRAYRDPPLTISDYGMREGAALWLAGQEPAEGDPA